MKSYHPSPAGIDPPPFPGKVLRARSFIENEKWCAHARRRARMPESFKTDGFGRGFVAMVSINMKTCARALANVERKPLLLHYCHNKLPSGHLARACRNRSSALARVLLQASPTTNGTTCARARRRALVGILQES
eukprot:3981968-Pyramimonas_sp.AAC.1